MTPASPFQIDIGSLELLSRYRLEVLRRRVVDQKNTDKVIRDIPSKLDVLSKSPLSQLPTPVVSIKSSPVTTASSSSYSIRSPSRSIVTDDYPDYEEEEAPPNTSNSPILASAIEEFNTAFDEFEFCEADYDMNLANFDTFEMHESSDEFGVKRKNFEAFESVEQKRTKV